MVVLAVSCCCVTNKLLTTVASYMKTIIIHVHPDRKTSLAS